MYIYKLPSPLCKRELIFGTSPKPQKMWFAFFP